MSKLKKVKLSKKVLGISLVAFLIITIGITGLKVVAEQDNPNMTLIAKVSENKSINTFEKNRFKINLTLDPGEYKITDNIFIKKVEGTTITLKGEDFKIVGTNNGKIENGEVILNPIEYSQRPPDLVSISPKINLELEIEALKAGEFIDDKSIDKLISFKYKNDKGNFISDKMLNCEADGDIKSINVMVDKIEYKAPEILAGEGPNKPVYYFGEVIELNYNLQFPELYTAIKGSNENQQRKVVYLVDEGALEKVDSNGEKVRDSLVKSLETSKIDNEFSLISYGSKAEIIKNEDKSFYGKDKLIEGIKAIEADEKNGNLGDGLRLVQTLINENKNSQVSVVLISEGNPAYYLVDSNENKISEFSSKTGESRSDFKKGEEYAREIVKLINEENKEKDVKWFNVNYGLDEKQEIPNKIIEELNGINSDYENPIIEAINEINEQANADFILEGYLAAEGKKGIRVSSKSILQKVAIPYRYKKDVNREIQLNEKGEKVLEPINQGKQAMKVGVKILSDKKIDLADQSVLTVSFVSELNKDEIAEFNKDKAVKWEINIETSFLKVSGLHTGKLNNLKLPEDFNEREEFDQLETIGTAILDGINGAYYSLARDNSFRLGSLLKPKSDIKINLEIDEKNIAENNSNVEKVNWTVYQFNKSNNSFEKLSLKELGDVKILNKEQIYLIVTDCTLKEKAEIGSKVNFSYNLEQYSGSSAGSNLLNESDSLEAKYFADEVVDINEETQNNKLGTIDTTVVVTEKPEHY